MKTATALHLATLTAYLTANGTPPQEAAQTIHNAHRMAKALRARYVATCNYPWANTPAYEKRTEKLEAKLCAMLEAAGFVEVRDINSPAYTSGLYYELQHDPRGWPLILSIGGRVERVGGEV